MLRYIGLVALISLVARPAFSQYNEVPKQIEARYSKDYDKCRFHGELTNGVAYPAEFCNNEELKTQDARLNQAYKMTMFRLTPAKKAELRASERQWIADRDRDCDARAVQDDADGRDGAKSECVLNKTIERTIVLEHYR